MLHLLVLVAFFWGSSGPILKRYSIQDVSSKAVRGGPLGHILSLFKRWKFVCAYLYDQLGSVLYYYVLGQTDLTTAVPIANGLTFAFSGLTEAVIDKKLPSRSTIEGSLLIIAGAYIAMSSKYSADGLI